jgi:diadenosine tetraphosphate (Ap4A) HIT family hydrolase
MIERLETQIDLPIVLKTNWFYVTPCRDCDIKGYLILRPILDVSCIRDLPIAAQNELGVIMARLEHAIQTVTGAERVYIIRFSESTSIIHFHIFPRTKKLAQEWICSEKGQLDQTINGELLFAWARINKRVKNSSALSLSTLEIAEQIMATLAQAAYASSYDGNQS